MRVDKHRRIRNVIIALIGVILLLGGLFAVSAQEDAPLYALPNANERYTASGSIATTQSGALMVAANLLNDTASVILPLQGELVTELPVGDDPRTVAITPDNARALVVNRGDGTLTVLDITDPNAPIVTLTYPVGLLPYGVVAATDTTAYVTLQARAEVIAIDITTGAITERIPTPAMPSGLLLWGDLLYVTHLWTGDVSLIHLPQKRVVRTVSTGAESSLSPSITLNPRTGTAYVPQSRSYAANPTPTYDTLVFPVVNALDLNTLGLSRGERVALDVIDRPVNMPFAAVVDPIRGWLYVANAGTDNVSVVELESGALLGHLEVGANPRGALLSRDGSLLYIHNAIDGTLTIVNTRDLSIRDVLPISDLTIPADTLIGAQLFHSAVDPRLSADNAVSCASCHFDGGSDGRVWVGFPGGPRNTPSLYGLPDTAPYTWSGGWDELADFELKVRDLMAGDGLIEGAINAALGDPHTGLSFDLDTLAAYIAAMPVPDGSPVTADPALIERGAAIFAERECASCHIGDAYTDGQVYDVGTGGTFDTPSLRWLWQTAPYFHDGRAESLQDVFILPGAHQLIDNITPDDIDALVAYLLTLPR